MTKRQAILAAIAGAIGIMSDRAKTQPITNATTNVFSQTPQTVWFDLDTYASFTFRSGGKEVTVSGKEIFEALNQ